MTDKKENLVRSDPVAAGRKGGKIGGRIGGKIGGKISRGGGRPKKYATEEERLEARRDAVRRYRDRKKSE